MDNSPPPHGPKNKRPRPAVLCVLDGWGCRPNASDNAIALARHPNLERMIRECPHGLLATSGRAVGLPDGQMGNSEVGHTNIGAGRLVMQDLVRVEDAVKDGSLASRPALIALIEAAKAATGTVHLMGLMSPGGVHSHQDHIAALARILGGAGLQVWVHAFLDGRDTPPQSAAGFVDAFVKAVSDVEGARIATLSGRYYAMDRDKRWERVAKAYAAMVEADGPRFADAKSAIEKSYAGGINDEFVIPCAIGHFAGMHDGDGLLFANFRPDRAREISTALLDPDFDGFLRTRVPRFSAAAGMTEYSKPLAKLMSALFPPQDVSETLGEIFAERGLKQLRIAETEKYPHVTFFMNGGRETKFEGEDRIMVPSPKVATYDLKPEMSAFEVTDRLVEAIASGKYDLVIVNYANADMVGHTGVMDAAIHAVEAVDICLGRLREAVEKAGGVLIVTADHGNVEQMKDPVTGAPHTAHTLLDVPIIVVNAWGRHTPFHLRHGRLADVAPTLLDLVGLPKPPQMTGEFAGRTRIRKSAAGDRKMKGWAILIPAFTVLLSVPFASSSALGEAKAARGGTLAERYRSAQAAFLEQRGNEDKTRAERDSLAAEAHDLQERLIANAAQVQELEAAYESTQSQLAGLTATMQALQADLIRDRDRVAHLLAVLQRLQADQPPALALRPEDSLAAARGTMQMGAMLPPVYREASDLANKLKTLAQVKTATARKGEEAHVQAASLTAARASLDRLLQEKSAEQANADAKLSELHGITEEIGREASDLKALTDRVASLRAAGPTSEGMRVVTAQPGGSGALTRGSLLRPVVGSATPGDPAGPGRTPGENGPLGLWFNTAGKAEAVAPADSEVVFAGTYQKFGQVLILEIAGGYHLTLAGLGRIDVHIGDFVLAGEPVGVLPEGRVARLYMELRRNGQAVDPAPWLSAELRKAKGT